jgi:hypothetical protein
LPPHDETEEEAIFKALTKAEEAFWKSFEKEGWDIPLQYHFEAAWMDVEGRVIKRVIINDKDGEHNVLAR